MLVGGAHQWIRQRNWPRPCGVAQVALHARSRCAGLQDAVGDVRRTRRCARQVDALSRAIDRRQGGCAQESICISREAQDPGEGIGLPSSLSADRKDDHPAALLDHLSPIVCDLQDEVVRLRIFTQHRGAVGRELDSVGDPQGIIRRAEGFGEHAVVHHIDGGLAVGE